MIRHVRAASLIVIALWIGGCATLPSVPADRTGGRPCAQADAETFILRGATDAAMRECVDAAFRPTIRTLILDSPGGSVAEALSIAERFEGRDLTMLVVGQCNSSCANYFLPLARRIELAPGSVVMLHGSVDAQLVAHMAGLREEMLSEFRRSGRTADEAEAKFDEFMQAVSAMAERQEAFARRNDVRPGWLLFRRSDSTGFEGTEGRTAGAGGRAVVVEEAMMRSCLPNADITPYRLPFAGSIVAPLREVWWGVRGMVRSGSLRCVQAP